MNGELDHYLLIDVNEQEWYDLNIAYLDMWVGVYNLPKVDHHKQIMPRVIKNNVTKIKKRSIKKKKYTITKSKVGNVKNYKTKSTIKVNARRSK